MGIREIIRKNKARKRFEKETFSREINLLRAKSLKPLKAERTRVQGRVKILKAQQKEQAMLEKARKDYDVLSGNKRKKPALKLGAKRFKGFAETVGKNVQKRSNNTKPNPLFSSTGSTNPIYTTTSGTNPYDFSGSTKKKAKKKRGKTITIRL